MESKILKKEKVSKLKTPKQCLKIGTIGSNARKSELESIADNVLKILIRTGNTFRNVSKKEYLEERKKDNGGKNICSSEEMWLDRFLEMFPKFDQSFSKYWE